MISAIVLAAGGARRFGSQKLLAELHGKPVVRWSVERLLEAQPDEVIVVAGADGEAIRAVLDGLPVRVVVNESWAEGIGSSLRAGIAALGAHADAAMIALGDQPSVEPRVIASLLNTHAEGDKAIVVPSYRGERGHPVIFAASIFPELLVLGGDRGARDVIACDPGRVAMVEFDAPLPPDVDTEAELRFLAR
ncbi:MAG TPA: nucleotidyltransferase family protein [Gemmatimonadaceae bacterium]|nr:nucleotidyltransferase family protein [Gemmatimonadaceae bacterium]